MTEEIVKVHAVFGVTSQQARQEVRQLGRSAFGNPGLKRSEEAQWLATSRY